jgi:hypothetical protein
MDQEMAQLKDQILLTQDAILTMDIQQISPLKRHKKFIDEVARAFEQAYDRKGGKQKQNDPISDKHP